ncbi:ribonuclease H-like domain-containing protein [Tanacetum coccineum]
MDDLYNNMKVYESKIKSKLSSSLNSQNVAFVSSDNSSSTNETVNTAHSISAVSPKDQASTASYADDIMFSFFSNQSNAPQLAYEDLEQIDAGDLEEMDLKWQVAMLTMRVKRFIKKTGRKIDLNDKETVGFDRTKVECYNCHRRGHFARECRTPRNHKNRNIDALRRNAPAEEGITNFALMAYTSQVPRDKAGLGYDGQMNESEFNNIHMNESEVVHSVFNSRESDVDDSPINDRFKIGEGFYAVPPPYTGNYMPSRPDLPFAELDESIFKSAVRKTTTSVLKIETSISKTSKDIVEKPKTIRPSAPIIEEWDQISVNHQNKLTHPHPKRNFVPAAVATKLRQVPVNAAKQSSPRAATSISTTRPINTAAPKPKVNDALPITYSYFQAHSPVRRAFNQKSAAKTNNFNKKVNTARVNNVTTARPKAVVSAAEGNKDNAVKSSACWIWRPTGNVIDHTSKDSGSYMLKRFDYVDLQGRLKSVMALY